MNNQTSFEFFEIEMKNKDIIFSETGHKHISLSSFSLWLRGFIIKYKGLVRTKEGLE